MGFFRTQSGHGGSGGSGGRGSGRGGVALPARSSTVVPPPPAAVAMGGQGGPVFPVFAGYYDTLPLRPAAPQDFSASPSELSYRRPVYDNTAGKDGYSAPTSFSTTLNEAVGPGSSPGASSQVPTTRKRYDSMTFYRWARTSAQRYPNQGEGTPRVHPRQLQRSRATFATQPQMQPGHQNQLTALPPATSFGSTTQPVLAPFQTGESVFA